MRIWAPPQPAWSEMAVEGESIPVEVVRRMLLAFGADVSENLILGGLGALGVRLPPMVIT